MTTTWGETKRRAIHGFNEELPNGDTEQAIIDAFTLQPLAVLRELDQVISAVQAGKARSGWAVWRSRIRTAITQADIEVDTENQPAQTRLAQIWIRNTGGYFDDAREIVDELFGARGRLRSWPELCEQMLELWESKREAFAAADAEAVERLERQGDTYRRLRGKRQRSACRVCGEPCRSEQHLCARHREAATEDFRYADTDLAFLDTLEQPEDQ